MAEVLKDQIGLTIKPLFTPDTTPWIVAISAIVLALAGLLPAILAYRTPVAITLPIG